MSGLFQWDNRVVEPPIGSPEVEYHKFKSSASFGGLALATLWKVDGEIVLLMVIEQYKLGKALGKAYTSTTY